MGKSNYTQEMTKLQKEYFEFGPGVNFPQVNPGRAGYSRSAAVTAGSFIGKRIGCFSAFKHFA